MDEHIERLHAVIVGSFVLLVSLGLDGEPAKFSDLLAVGLEIALHSDFFKTGRVEDSLLDVLRTV